MRCAKPLRALPIAVLLALTICISGCAGYSSAAINLPNAPAIMSAEPRPDVIGLHPRIAVKSLSLAVDRANARLDKSRAWYLGIKKRYGAARL